MAQRATAMGTRGYPAFCPYAHVGSNCFLPVPLQHPSNHRVRRSGPSNVEDAIEPKIDIYAVLGTSWACAHAALRCAVLHTHTHPYPYIGTYWQTTDKKDEKTSLLGLVSYRWPTVLERLRTNHRRRLSVGQSTPSFRTTWTIHPTPTLPAIKHPTTHSLPSHSISPQF